MQAKIKDYIEQNELLQPHDKVVVAVSGGADSVALLVVLCALGYDCIAMHCNFHLRGEDSMRDMRFVESLCARLGVELHIKEFDVEAYRRVEGCSVEMACRDLRYAWFAEQLERTQAAAIAVGHHREDRVETFFLNLLRGTGLSGLTSMKPRRDNIVRPLLSCSRIEIEQYLHDRGFEWVTDCTNASDEFLRNRLRNRLLPLMEELFPGGSDAVLRTIDNLEENKAFYDRAIASEAEKYRDDENDEVDLKKMWEQSPNAPLLLFEMMRGEGFNRQQTDCMLLAANNAGGRFVTTRNHAREVDHGVLRASRYAVMDKEVPVALDATITYPITIEISQHEKTEFAPERNADVAYLDISALDADRSWELRHWRRGDRMKPFGLSGSKLLSDIFADARLSEYEKRSAWLLTCDGEIVWAVGLRASSLFAVTEKTDRYLRLQFKKTS